MSLPNQPFCDSVILLLCQPRALPNSAALADFLYAYRDHGQHPATDCLHENQKLQESLRIWIYSGKR